MPLGHFTQAENTVIFPPVSPAPASFQVRLSLLTQRLPIAIQHSDNPLSCFYCAHIELFLRDVFVFFLGQINSFSIFVASVS